MLANMGLISFAAALQFAPVILGGIFWERGNKIGAQFALVGGIGTWFYTLVIPAFAKTGWAFESLTTNGPFGVELLKPEALFGMTAMDPLSQSMFWSMLINITLYMTGSMLFEAKATGMTLARDFVNILDHSGKPLYVSGNVSIDLTQKTKKIIKTLTRYVNSSDAGLMFVNSIRRAGLSGRRKVSLNELAELLGEIEKTLAGAVGAAEAHSAIMSANVYTDDERAKLSNMYADILADLKLTPGELKERVDYYKERETMLSKQATELETRVKARTIDLEAANKELEAFSYSVSHDLRAPLRSIDGFSQALIEDYEDKLDAEGLDFLSRVRNASQRMGDLIDDILALSHMTRIEMEREPVDLGEIALEIVRSIRERDPETKVEIDIKPGLKAEADPRLIRLALENLIGNAWKFSAENDTPQITFGTEEALGQTWFVIRDNGAGFDMQYVDKLFQVFSRLHSQEEFEGTGIGLAIVDRVIRKHGGNIWAESQVGAGAAFFFTLR
jgi:signal transduction histidine kinase